MSVQKYKDFRELKAKIEGRNFTKGACCVQEKDSANPDYCVCGNKIDDHKEKEDIQKGKEWERSHCTTNDELTNAFGRIRFKNHQTTPPEFLRLFFGRASEKTLKRIFSEIWCLPEPELAILVIGECEFESFELVDTIVQTALSTKSLLITNGYHAGVAKLVAEQALKYEKKVNEKNENLTLFGVGHWGTIKGHSQLENDKAKDEIEKAYDASLEDAKENQNKHANDVLDPNHSHFLLVDDGTYRKGVTDNSINSVAELLSNLGSCQVVTVAFDEKVNTIKTVIRNLQYNLPCILLTSSKKFSSIFDYALEKLDDNNKLNENDIAKIKVHFRKLFFDKDEYDEFTHFNEVIQKRYNKKVENSFISIISKKRKKYFVQLSPKDPPSVLKNKILDFYFDANVIAGSNRNIKLSVIEQLKRALKWECHPTAKKYFYNKPFPGTREELNQLIIQATAENQVEFLKIFISMGFDKKETFKPGNTDEFPGPKDLELFEIFLKKQKNIVDFFGMRKRIESKMRQLEAPGKVSVDSIIKEIKKDVLRVFEKYLEDKYKYKNNWTITLIHKLFILACIFGNYESAIYLASIDENPLANYIVGKKIFQNHEEKFKNTSMHPLYKNYRSKFEEAACVLFERVYSKDDLKAYQMLFVKIQIYNNQQCIRLAKWAESLEFLNIKSINDMLHSNYMYFNCWDQIKERRKNCQAQRTNRIGPQPETDQNTVETAGEAPVKKSKWGNFTESVAEIAKRTVWFFKMPFLKFLSYHVFYMFFLILFSYVLVCNFYPVDYNGSPITKNYQPLVISIPEIVLIIWIISFVFEGFYFFIVRWMELKDPYSFNKATMKIIFWNPKTWAILLSIPVVAIRFIPSCYNCYLAARIILCFDIWFWVLSLFKGLKGIKQLGPLIIMIIKMVKIICLFMCVVFLIMFTYGVSTQALMYHNQPSTFGQVLGNIFLPSFFMIVGNDYTFDSAVSFGECTVSDSRKTTDEYVNDYTNQNACPDEIGSKVAMVIHIVFAIALNILLVNLLIAILNNIYDDIEKLSKKLYNLQFHEHFYKYKELKATLPPPFNLLHVIELMVIIKAWVNDDDFAYKWTRDLRTTLDDYDAELTFDSVSDEKFKDYNNSSTEILHLEHCYEKRNEYTRFIGLQAEKIYLKMSAEDNN